MARFSGAVPIARWLEPIRGWHVGSALTVVFLIFVYLAWDSYQTIQRELTDSAVSRRHSVVQLAAATLSEKFERLIGINTALASQVQFRRLVEDGEWRKAAEILRNVPSDFPYINRIFLTDRSGTEMADIPALTGAVGKNFSHRDWYTGLADGWKPYVSRVYTRAAEPQINVFAVSVPIRDMQGAVIGVLVSQINLDGFFDWARGLDIGSGGFLYVVDGQGRLAYHPRYPSQGKIIDFSSAPVVQKAIQGESGVMINFNPIEKQERLSAFMPVDHGWAVVVQQPVTLAFAARDRQLNRILFGYGLILLFCFLVVVLAALMIRQRHQHEEDRRVREELEKRVAERTEELQTVNKELESFSYSVSHDLRSPLRAVEGFSLILEEDYDHILDDEGRRLLAVIQDNARRMHMLIDDLLKFSRLGRQPIKTVTIDMDRLVAEVCEEVIPRGAAASVQVNGESLPQAPGDRSLLKQVWINLLSNAVKYSSTREESIIEYGGHVDGEEIVYHVRDNGVGFDMQYYDKVFTIFQRLHRDEEFAGTGIGLAIVQRVVNRHGGRVWAESRLGEGSIFYFSLKKDEPDGT